MASTAEPSHAAPGPALDNRRVAAAAIDLAAPALALTALALGGLLTLGVAVVVLGWTLYYFFALESGGGQTLGKRAMKLRVVDADGKAPTMREVAMRTVIRVIDLPVIGLIAMMASGDRRQRLGDMAAGTSVVDAESFRGTPAFAAADTAHLHQPAPTPYGEPAESKPKRARRTLGGPELKLPKLSRPRKPKRHEAAPKPAKSGRRTLGGPELKLPKLRGRRRTKTTPRPLPPETLRAPVEPAPVEPTPPFAHAPQAEVPDAIDEFDLFDDQEPGPEVEVIAEPEPEPGLEPEYSDLDDIVGTDAVPDVQIAAEREPDLSPDPAPAPAPRTPEAVIARAEQPRPEPQRPRPSAIPGIPAPDAPPVASDAPPVASDAPPVVSRPPTVPAALDPERRDQNAIGQERDTDGPTIQVKPIRTVSAMDLIMQEAEQEQRSS